MPHHTHGLLPTTQQIDNNKIEVTGKIYLRFRTLVLVAPDGKEYELNTDHILNSTVTVVGEKGQHDAIIVNQIK